MAADPGLQAERTALAWTRTSIAALLLAVAMLGRAAAQGQVADLVVAVAAAVTAGTAAIVPRVAHGRTLAAPSAPWWRLVTVVAATVLLAAGGVVTALLSADASHL